MLQEAAVMVGPRQKATITEEQVALLAEQYYSTAFPGRLQSACKLIGPGH